MIKRLCSKEDLDKLVSGGKLEMDFQLNDFVEWPIIYQKAQKMIDGNAGMKIGREITLSDGQRDNKVKVSKVAMPTVKVIFESVD